MVYGAFVKESFERFEFLSKSDSTISPSGSVEAFSDYPEERAVWLELCEFINRRDATEEASLNLLLQEWV